MSPATGSTAEAEDTGACPDLVILTRDNECRVEAWAIPTLVLVHATTSASPPETSGFNEVDMKASDFSVAARIGGAQILVEAEGPLQCRKLSPQQ